eukprot:13024726-Ditylum_brightwellii.AAC.1
MAAMTATNNQHLFSLQTQNQVMMIQMQQTNSQQILQLQQTTSQQSQQMQRIEELLANLGTGGIIPQSTHSSAPQPMELMAQWNHK